ncbi:MAG TPA: hypothetical protein VLD84_02005 [Nitrososphaeraceae archaeon]|nr:hypothetical protein [Nitrososphaeraceae archaeon]
MEDNSATRKQLEIYLPQVTPFNQASEFLGLISAKDQENAPPSFSFHLTI